MITIQEARKAIDRVAHELLGPDPKATVGEFVKGIERAFVDEYDKLDEYTVMPRPGEHPTTEKRAPRTPSEWYRKMLRCFAAARSAGMDALEELAEPEVTVTVEEPAPASSPPSSDGTPDSAPDEPSSAK